VAKTPTIKAIDPEVLLKKNSCLIQSDNKKVTSHVQRSDGGWILNTVMIEACDVPFQFKRQKPYKNLTGSRVNLSYYPDNKVIHGLTFESMKVVRIRIT